MKGPFYNYMSKEGIKEDNFTKCSTQDLIDSANMEVMRILIIGKPRTGKTTVAKALAEKLDLVRIAPELWIDDLLARIKDREENPHESDEESEKEEQPEDDQKEAEPAGDEEGEKPEGEEVQKKEEEVKVEEPSEPVRAKKDRWLTDLEYEVRNILKKGACLTSNMIDQILCLQVGSASAQTKGFVFDLDLMKNDKDNLWAVRLIDAGIISDDNEITHVIELLADDPEIKQRAIQIRVQTETGIPFSNWERVERNKPKVKTGDEEDDDPVDDDDEDDLSKKPLEENKMVIRPCDTYDKFSREVDYYNMRERGAFDEFIVKMWDSTYVKIDVAGYTPDELSGLILAKLKPNSANPLRPIAHIIEDGGSYKELLTAGKEDDDNFSLPRQFSLWKTTDPVALSKGQVEQGQPEFAAHYANNVFVF